MRDILQYPGRAKYNLTTVRSAVFDGVSSVIKTTVRPGVTGFFELDYIPGPYIATGTKTIIGVRDSINTRRILNIINGVFFLGVGGNSAVQVGNYQPPPGVSIGIRVEWTETVFTVIVDGVIKLEYTYTPFEATVQPFYIGAMNSAGAILAGTYSNGTIQRVNIMGVEFPLNEGAGTTVYGSDDVGNSYQGEITTADISAFWPVIAPENLVVSLPVAPELISVLGLNSAYYDDAGVPKPVAWSTLLALEGPVTFGSEERNLFCVYDPALEGTNLTKANKYFNVTV